MGVGEALDGHTEGELSAVTVAVQVAAVMRVQSLAQEFPHAVGAVGKKKKKAVWRRGESNPWIDQSSRATASPWPPLPSPRPRERLKRTLKEIKPR